VVQKLNDKVRALTGELGNVHFSYRDPVKNFDRSKVKGVVARLIKIKDSSTATALEVGLSILILVLKLIFSLQ
jgi:structural maintenance of chromosome 2